MIMEPQTEHGWLHQLVGDWRFEADCNMGKDQSSTKTVGTEIVRSLGGLWTVGEGMGEMPNGTTHTSIMTLGYDPQKKRFVGTFISSMSTHLWLYEGALNEQGTVLTLDTEGPSVSGDQTLARYQDILEIVDDHHRILSSQVLGSDGTWTGFMTAHYFRKTN